MYTIRKHYVALLSLCGCIRGLYLRYIYYTDTLEQFIVALCTLRMHYSALSPLYVLLSCNREIYSRYMYYSDVL